MLWLESLILGYLTNVSLLLFWTSVVWHRILDFVGIASLCPPTIVVVFAIRATIIRFVVKVRPSIFLVIGASLMVVVMIFPCLFRRVFRLRRIRLSRCSLWPSIWQAFVDFLMVGNSPWCIRMVTTSTMLMRDTVLGMIPPVGRGRNSS